MPKARKLQIALEELRRS